MRTLVIAGLFWFSLVESSYSQIEHFGRNDAAPTEQDIQAAQQKLKERQLQRLVEQVAQLTDRVSTLEKQVEVNQLEINRLKNAPVPDPPQPGKPVVGSMVYGDYTALVQSQYTNDPRLTSVQNQELQVKRHNKICEENVGKRVIKLATVEDENEVYQQVRVRLVSKALPSELDNNGIQLEEARNLKKGTRLRITYRIGANLQLIFEKFEDLGQQSQPAVRRTKNE